MQKLISYFLYFTLFTALFSCKQKATVIQPELKADLQGSINLFNTTSFDSTAIDSFFIKYPLLTKRAENVKLIYRGHGFHHFWFDERGVLEFANSLYGKVKSIASEGVYENFPYPAAIEGIFEQDMENLLTKTETELMITNMFLFYAEKVYRGIDDNAAVAIEWLLPKKQVSYKSLLDSLLILETMPTRNDSLLFSQYYLLRDVLYQYRDIQKKGGWDSIFVDRKMKVFKPGDTATAIVQIRKRLYATGELTQNNGSNTLDDELLAAVQKFQLKHGKTVKQEISRDLIRELNVSVFDLTKKIVVNMERCRWVSPDFASAGKYIFVNIPAYNLVVVNNGEVELESPVVVGKNMSKTVIFSGDMNYIVFSPYWNIPPSIIENEVLPGIKKDKDYLAKHNMEWYNGQLRQKPGKGNSLGKVKFLFPNSNNIYLHDTPLKSHFNRESRAFSHGCIRVAKPNELAEVLLKNDSLWTPDRIRLAMNKGKEDWVKLKDQVPVHIGYFTAWVNRQGGVRFYEDVYNLDNRLFDILIGYQNADSLVTAQNK